MRCQKYKEKCDINVSSIKRFDMLVSSMPRYYKKLVYKLHRCIYIGECDAGKNSFYRPTIVFDPTSLYFNGV